MLPPLPIPDVSVRIVAPFSMRRLSTSISMIPPFPNPDVAAEIIAPSRIDRKGVMILIVPPGTNPVALEVIADLNPLSLVPDRSTSWALMKILLNKKKKWVLAAIKK